MSESPASRPLRVDAARNAERIVRAALETFDACGPDAPAEEVARRAGVGTATLYRRFPRREDLVRAAMLRCLVDEVDPVVRRALDADDPWEGMVSVLEATLAMSSRERNTVTAANRFAVVVGDITRHFLDPLTTLVRRCQDEGKVRADLAREDIPAVVLMLVSVLWAFDRDSGGWRRYCALVLDGLRPSATRLPPPQPYGGDGWPPPPTTET